MTHTQCPKCRRRKIVVIQTPDGPVLAPHFRSARRKGGTCRATGTAPTARAA